MLANIRILALLALAAPSIVVGTHVPGNSEASSVTPADAGCPNSTTSSSPFAGVTTLDTARPTWTHEPSPFIGVTTPTAVQHARGLPTVTFTLDDGSCYLGAADVPNMHSLVSCSSETENSTTAALAETGSEPEKTTGSYEITETFAVEKEEATLPSNSTIVVPDGHHEHTFRGTYSHPLVNRATTWFPVPTVSTTTIYETLHFDGSHSHPPVDRAETWFPVPTVSTTTIYETLHFDGPGQNFSTTSTGTATGAWSASSSTATATAEKGEGFTSSETSPKITARVEGRRSKHLSEWTKSIWATVTIRADKQSRESFSHRFETVPFNTSIPTIPASATGAGTAVTLPNALNPFQTGSSTGPIWTGFNLTSPTGTVIPPTRTSNSSVPTGPAASAVPPKFNTTTVPGTRIDTRTEDAHPGGPWTVPFLTSTRSWSSWNTSVADSTIGHATGTAVSTGTGWDDGSEEVPEPTRFSTFVDF